MVNFVKKGPSVLRVRAVLCSWMYRVAPGRVLAIRATFCNWCVVCSKVQDVGVGVRHRDEVLKTPGRQSSKADCFLLLHEGVLAHRFTVHDFQGYLAKVRSVHSPR